MKHFQFTTRPPGPNVFAGGLIYQMPGGAAIACSCIPEPYVGAITEMWRRKDDVTIGLDFEALRARLLAACQAAGGQKAWARAHNLSETYVAEILRRRREPGETICAALGLRRHVAYLPIETERRAL